MLVMTARGKRAEYVTWTLAFHAQSSSLPHSIKFIAAGSKTDGMKELKEQEIKKDPWKMDEREYPINEQRRA